MDFEWDSQKAETNSKKHEVSFEEASTVFGDYLSFTYPDAGHSIREERYIIIGLSGNNRILVISHTQCGEVSELSVLDRQRNESEISMNPENSDELNDELLDEYDFSKMSNGVRGKYVKQYHEGVKLMWHKYFPMQNQSTKH
jgi:uncharacterized protein